MRENNKRCRIKTEERNKKGFSAIGLCSLITVFTVLCMSIFAVLSVASVQADLRLAQRSNEAVGARYEADCHAEEILSSLRQGQMPAEVRILSRGGKESAGEIIYAYSCPVSDTQKLEVRVKIEKEEYEVLQWIIVPTVRWEIDETLNLWDGE